MGAGPAQIKHVVGQIDPTEQALLRWRSIPARRSRTSTLLVVLIVLAVPLLLFVWYGPFFGILGFLIMGGSLSSFFLPTDYCLTDQSVYRHYLGIRQKRAWSEFRSFHPDRNGVLLSPFARPSRLENFRGLYLRFEGNRDDVLAVVREMVHRTPSEGAP